MPLSFRQINNAQPHVSLASGARKRKAKGPTTGQA